MVDEMTRWLVPLAIAVVVAALDRLSKTLIREWLPARSSGSRHDLVGNWLGLDYVENRGAAFGTLSEYGGLLTLLALLVVLGMVALYRRVPSPSIWLRLGLGLLVGGATGNVVDRLVYGYVVDFVAVGPWPRFNLADSSITIGVLLLAWRLSGDAAAAGERTASELDEKSTARASVDDGTPRPGQTGSTHE
jgi:signal peptidase II